MNLQYNQNIELLILKNINKTTSQKSIAQEIGYSAGKVNYILKALIEKSMVKVENFMNNKNKKQYKYLLTEDGIKYKINITEQFIKRKKEEYEMLQADLEKYKEIYGDMSY
jgi:EPS-associated MarR family transcriptional regulator